jgi:phosphoketolase
MRPETDALSADELRKMHAYWRAANYLSVGQIYLLDDPLLKEPLARAHVKPRLLGHWGDGVTTFAVPNLQAAAPNGLTYSICDQGIFPSPRAVSEEMML